MTHIMNFVIGYVIGFALYKLIEYLINRHRNKPKAPEATVVAADEVPLSLLMCECEHAVIKHGYGQCLDPWCRCRMSLEESRDEARAVLVYRQKQSKAALEVESLRNQVEELKRTQYPQDRV